MDEEEALSLTPYAHVLKDERDKLDSKAKKCILVGYGEETKGYQGRSASAKMYHSVKTSVVLSVKPRIRRKPLS